MLLKSPTQHLYAAAGCQVPDLVASSGHVCHLCGGPAFQPMPWSEWVRPTFTNHDLCRTPESDFICRACIWCAEDKNAELTARRGADKPQRMRNYSHIVQEARWTPLSKAEKPELRRRLLTSPFPSLAVIADSGQRHLIFRAQVNPSPHDGIIQFEEEQLLVRPAELRRLLRTIDALYAGFSKGEIESGQYAQHRIQKFGLTAWRELEDELTHRRGEALLRLALYLAQKPEATDGRKTG